MWIDCGWFALIIDDINVVPFVGRECGFAMLIDRRGERPFAPTGFVGVWAGSIANNRDDGKMIGNCDRLSSI